MPRVSIEKKIKFGSLSKIVTEMYEIPDTIVVDRKVYSYNSYFRAYQHNLEDFISAGDYIKSQLKENKEKETSSGFTASTESEELDQSTKNNI